MVYIAKKEGSLLECLQEMFQDSSKTTLRSWLAEERILLNGRVVKDPRTLVAAEDRIEVKKKRKYLFSGVEILCQDPEFVVVYKPAGLLSVATDTDPLDNLHDQLKMEFKGRTVHPVHRLDREASGILVFAFSEEALLHLKEQFEAHTTKRHYLAVVEGIIPEDKGTWESILLEEDTYYVRSVTDPTRGRRAVTHYEVEKRGPGFSVLRVTLETGRKNQIRVHTSEAGFPILGDAKYHARSEFHDRIALQALCLGFTHPKTQRQVVFEREPDPEFLCYLSDDGENKIIKTPVKSKKAAKSFRRGDEEIL